MTPEQQDFWNQLKFAHWVNYKPVKYGRPSPVGEGPLLGGAGLCLEGDARAQLHAARSACSGYDAKGVLRRIGIEVVHTGVRVAELRRVGDAGGFAADFQLDLFGDGEDLEERRIEVEEAGAVHYVAACVAEHARERGLREGGRVEPGVTDVDTVQDLNGLDLVGGLVVAGGVEGGAVGPDRHCSAGHEGEDTVGLPAAESLGHNAVTEEALAFAEGQVIDVALDKGVGTIEVIPRIIAALIDVPVLCQPTIVGTLVAHALAVGVGSGNGEAIDGATVHFHLEGVVVGAVACKQKGGGGSPTEVVELRQAGVPQIGLRGGGIHVVAHNRIHAVVADVGNIHGEAEGEGLLDGEVPLNAVRILEVGIDYRVSGVLVRIRDDTVGGNRSQDGGRETLLEGRHGAIGQDCGAITGDCRIIDVVLTDGVIVGVAVIRERGIADAKAGADNCF